MLAAAAGCGVVTAPPQDDAGSGSGTSDGGGSEGEGESPGNQVPRVPIAGLPIGGTEFTLVDEAWCGEAFVLPTPPAGVQVTIVEITGIDATVVDRTCPGSASCGSSTLDEQNSACTVAVRPDSATATEVQVVFDAYVTCDTEQTCGDYGDQIGSGATWTLSAPEGWPLPTTPTEPGEGGSASASPDGDGGGGGDGGDGGDSGGGGGSQ
jgi:hypothetical protein